jgi:hypothetical protein
VAAGTATENASSAGSVSQDNEAGRGRKGMGYGPGVARRAAWQFLNKVPDPRLSSLRRFAKAIGVPLKDLIS